MKDRAIYLDLDGVLADFDRGVSEALGWSVIDELGHIPYKDRSSEQRKLDKQMIDHIINTPDFWYNLKLTPEAKDIWAVAQKFPVAVITAPILRDPTCESQKRAWVRKRFPAIPEENVFVTPARNKYNYINSLPGRFQLLIDDSPRNIADWRSAGGLGMIHDPRNPTKTLDTIRKMGYY